MSKFSRLLVSFLVLSTVLAQIAPARAYDYDRCARLYRKAKEYTKKGYLDLAQKYLGTMESDGCPKNARYE